MVEKEEKEVVKRVVESRCLLLLLLEKKYREKK